MEKFKNFWDKANSLVKNNLLLILIILGGVFWIFDDDSSVFPYQNLERRETDTMMMKNGLVNEEMAMSKAMSYGRRGGMVPPIAHADFVPDAPERKIIKSASLTIEVADTEVAKERATSRIKDLEAFITHMNSWEVRSGILAYNLTIRVPADKLEDMMKKLIELGVKKAEKFSTSDITAQYMDTENRLKNLRARRDRLREMMKRKTDKLVDVLAIDRELSNVQSQIENYERSQKQRDTNVAYSTLNLTINPETQIGDFTNPNWNITKSWRSSVNDFMHSLQKIVDKIIKFVIYIPLWVPVLLLAWWGKKKWQKTKNSK